MATRYAASLARTLSRLAVSSSPRAHRAQARKRSAVHNGGSSSRRSSEGLVKRSRPSTSTDPDVGGTSGPSSAEERASSGASAACPVCRESPAAAHFATVAKQTYWRCPHCRATFLDSSHHLSLEAEKARYEKHENGEDSPGYRRFLSSLADPLLARLGRSAPNHKASRGLDYGCGPGPALAAMLREAGHEVAVYDPIFAPDRAAVAAGTQYDFVTCTEVAEHFYRPAEEFDTMAALVRGGGLLAVLTSFQPESADQFAEWHYRRDPTHVVFYGAGTLALLAEERGWTCEIPVKDVAIMRKPVDSS